MNIHAAFQHGIDQAVFNAFNTTHEPVAVRVTVDPLDRLASVLCQDPVKTVAGLQDFLRMDIDLRRLLLETAQRLVNHHT